VSITARPENRAAIADLPWFQSAVRRVFQHRRKRLRAILGTAWGDALTKSEAETLLETQGLDPQLRPEALNVAEWVALADALKERIGDHAVRGTIAAAGLTEGESP
jgi:16S rRNA A1518/A1519 N6-dimethyltransferase RsmA/KsgA/DIM1 with predicted DNA glycosylase/AP lyase activity